MVAPLRSMVGMPSSFRDPPGRSDELRNPAFHLVGELAERADRAGRYLSAARALVEGHRLGALEGGTRPLEKAEEEVVLGARRGVLHAAQDLLVGDRRGPLRERAFLDDVVDLSQEGEGGRLSLRE